MVTQHKPDASFSDMFGIPVLVQLRTPCVLTLVKGKSTIPYSDKSSESQWIPEELIGPDKSPEATLLVRFAVLRACATPSFVEMTWMCPGEKKGDAVQVVTMVNLNDIAYVSRVAEVIRGPEESLLVKP